MSDWTDGYVAAADIDYTHGYYGELNPLRSRLGFLLSGLVPPEVGTACELGFGHGVSTAIHAAATPVAWYGTDFNPAQVAFARELAAASSADIVLSDESFAGFAQRQDLPDFDYIGLHGIWSWISNDNRAVIVDFVRRKLKAGGILYLSYNAQPGWAAFAPLRHLMTEHADLIGVEAHGIVNRIGGALDFIDSLIATNPAYLRANPKVADRLKLLKEQNRQYLAHEYLNRDWVPMHFGTIARWLEPAKMSFACSADYLDHYDAMGLTPEQHAFLSKIPSNLLRQSVRDFMVDRQFRRDYWVKGARRLARLERTERLRAEWMVLVTRASDVSLKMGEATLQAQIYEPVLELLADHAPRTVGEIDQALQGKGIAFNLVVEALTILAGLGHVAPAQSPEASGVARERTDRLNTRFLEAARSKPDIMFLASPVTAGGVPLSRFRQLFLLAMRQGRRAPKDLAQFVWELLVLQGERIIKDGRKLETPEENQDELNAQAAEFVDRHLPILKALQVG